MMPRYTYIHTRIHTYSKAAFLPVLQSRADAPTLIAKLVSEKRIDGEHMGRAGVVQVRVYVGLCVCMHASTHGQGGGCAGTCVCMFVYMYACMNTWVGLNCVYVYVCIYVCAIKGRGELCRYMCM